MEKKLKEVAYIIEPIFTHDNEEEKLSEIKALTTSAGADVFGHICHVVREITPSTFIGSGKLEEIRQEIVETDVNIVIFDGELSPSQTLNISAALNDIKVIDRTTLILDIFALNAMSSEGKLQIELAQLKYIYPRLKGKGQALSRLGGGIGTRGPGETKLETDRRHIRARINALKKKLNEMETRRSMQLYRREKNECKTVALVGYTNTGKSTLMNALTGADTYVQNKPFATLDPTTRKLKLDDYEVLLIDTVGFVKNIPHHIIEAFKSTLEFAVKADVILNVCDGSGMWQSELKTTTETLEQFANLPPIITVINKCDKISDFNSFPKDAVFISAKENVGLDRLKIKLNDILADYYSIFSIKILYTDIQEFIKLSHHASNVKYEYLDEYVKVEFSLPKYKISKFKKFI